MIEDDGLNLTDDLKAAVSLTPWAVEFRYADPFAPNPLDRAEALATVAAVRQWAEQAISKKSVGSSSDSSEDQTMTDEQ